MLEVPLDVILSWPKPNYVNPETRGPGLLIFTIVVFCITTPTVCLRLYIRHFQKHKFGWDDFFCAVAFLLSIAFSINALLVDLYFHSLRHVWDIPFTDFAAKLIVSAVCQLLFTVGSSAIRQSLLCFYLRLLDGADIRWFRYWVYVLMAFNFCIAAIFGTMSIVQCSPVSAYWKFPSSFYGTCVHDAPLTLAMAISTVVCDFMVVLSPIPIVVRLQMSTRMKVGAVCCLSMGLVAGGVSILRCYFLWKVFYDTYDTTWWAFPILLTSSAELNIGLICSCAPAVRPWIVKHMPWTANLAHWIGTSNTRSTKHSSAARTPQDLGVAPYDMKEFQLRKSMESRLEAMNSATSSIHTGTTTPPTIPSMVEPAHGPYPKKIPRDRLRSLSNDNDDDLSMNQLYHRELRLQKTTPGPVRTSRSDDKLSHHSEDSLV